MDQTGDPVIGVRDCVFIAAMQCLEYVAPTHECFKPVEVMELVARCAYMRGMHVEVRQRARNVAQDILLQHNSAVFLEGFSNFTRTLWTPDMNPLRDAGTQSSAASLLGDALAQLANMVREERRKRKTALENPFDSASFEFTMSPWLADGCDGTQSDDDEPLTQHERRRMHHVATHLEESALLGPCCIDSGVRMSAIRVLKVRSYALLHLPSLLRTHISIPQINNMRFICLHRARMSCVKF